MTQTKIKELFELALKENDEYNARIVEVIKPSSEQSSMFINVKLSTEVAIVNDMGRLGQDEIQKMLEDAEKFRKEDKALRHLFEEKIKLDQCVRIIESLI